MNPRGLETGAPPEVTAPLLRRSFIATLSGCLLRCGPVGFGAAAANEFATGGVAQALGRLPLGGTVRVSLPWATTSLDPHDANDALSAFIGDSVFETLYSMDAHGRPYPTLAQDLPTQEGQDSVLGLRPGLRSAHGEKLTAAHALWSLDRSRLRGGGAVLRQFARPTRVRGDELALRFPGVVAAELAAGLSSPLTALVPRGFRAGAPDSWGAFRATPGPTQLVLERNLNAARGPALLDQVVLRSVSTLTDALRDFEVDRADVGWLGRGLHRPRSDSQMVTGRSVGWIVMHTGTQAGKWGSPGVANQLLRSLNPAQLARFGLRPPSRTSQNLRYAGPSCELVTRNDSGYLRELGQALANLLTQPNHAVQLRSVPPAELQNLKRTRQFCFLLDMVRSAGASRRAQHSSLLHEADPQLVRRLPPTPHTGAVEQVTRTLPLGVLGEMNVTLAITPRFERLEQFTLADVWQANPD